MVQHDASTSQSCKIPPETAKILPQRHILVFLHDEEFVSRAITDGSEDLDKFQTSKVYQLAKRMESSKATAWHIKQVSGDPQTALMNFLRHQCTELPEEKIQGKKSSGKPRQTNYKQHRNEDSQVQSQHKKIFDTKSTHQNKDRCCKCGDSDHVKDFNVLLKSTSVKHVASWGTLPVFIARRNKLLTNEESKRHTHYGPCRVFA